jgi:hypothetical protein
MGCSSPFAVIPVRQLEPAQVLIPDITLHFGQTRQERSVSSAEVEVRVISAQRHVGDTNIIWASNKMRKCD